MADLPIICIPCNRFEWEKASSHGVKHKYVEPLVKLAKCVPLLIPAIGEDFKLESIAHKIDGLLLTGATSNLCPSHYGTERKFDEKHLDTHRDSTSLPLIRAAIDMDMPLFAICRGFQELNVTLGGTLHQHVQELPGKIDHRGKDGHAKHHGAVRKNGGLLERLGAPETFTVNTLHEQGIDKLGEGLIVEAEAEDGIVEAISLPGKRFIFGTQWHPEEGFEKNPVSIALFEEFGRIIRA